MILPSKDKPIQTSIVKSEDTKPFRVFKTDGRHNCLNK